MWDRNGVSPWGQKQGLRSLLAPGVAILGAVLLAVVSFELVRRFVRGAAFAVLFVTLFLGAMLFAPREARAQMESIRIENVMLVDGTGSAPRLASVLIEDGRIRETGPPGTEDGAHPGERIDGAGKFLVPGFIDTHAHVALGPVGLVEVDGRQVLGTEPDSGISTASLRTLLAYGITTIRDPGGPATTLVDLRERQKRGELVGPRLVVAGEVIDRLPMAGLTTRVETTDDVRREVRRQAEAGVDWIKLYTSLEPDMVAAGVEEAKLHGLDVAAHLDRTDWTEASRLGVDSLLHIIPGSAELLPKERRDLLRQPPPGTHMFYRWFELVDFGSPEIRELVETLVENQTAVDPTMVAFESIFLGGEERREGLRGLELAPPALLENWRSFFHFNIGWTDQHFERARRAWPRALEFLALLHDSGVLLTTGTDANNPWVVPGVSYHRELEIFSEIGVPAVEVLSIGSRNGARALGLEAEIGTIEVGKRADLVLLTRDPTESISNTVSIEWVMQEGKRYHPEQLLEPIRQGTGGSNNES